MFVFISIIDAVDAAAVDSRYLLQPNSLDAGGGDPVEDVLPGGHRAQLPAQLQTRLPHPCWGRGGGRGRARAGAGDNGGGGGARVCNRLLLIAHLNADHQAPGQECF